MAAGLAASLASANSKAATLIVDLPSQTGLEYNLDSYFTNDDNGAVYNSANTDVISTLANQIYGLGNSGQSSVEDMMNTELGLSIRDGEVDNGWSADAVGSSIDLTNNGFSPDVSYDTWQSTSSNSNQDTLAFRATVPNTLLEQNGTSGYQSFNFTDTQNTSWNPANYDPIVVLTGTTEANDLFNASNYNGIVPSATIDPAFVGYDGGLGSWSTNGPQYALVNPNDFGAIPEPSTVGLIGLSALAYAGSRRRQDKSQDTKYD